jgi:hypothetical protein
MFTTAGLSILHFRDTTCSDLIIFTPLTLAAFMACNRTASVETEVIYLKF